MTVLIVEDDRVLARALAIVLRAHGDEPVVATTGREAISLAAQVDAAAMILDLGLPDMDGFAVIEAVRGWSAMPIVVLSARHEPREKVRALDAGADDYVTKPFDVDELLARLRAATRRRAGETATREVRTASFTVDLAARRVVRDGAEVGVTPTEWRLLEMLAREPGRVVAREDLLASLRGPSVPHRTHYLRVYVQQLRAKLEPVPAEPRHLITVPGVGYRLDL
ncbi:response regulator [Demequina silvatica]|uniref:response regulator n=1 Tax=Demequina silvatica TaxID=1638988 RepID=UPI000785447A|nr:response regulator transcription factor [Demequina silvatica]